MSVLPAHPLLRNRNVLFWTLHAAGWLAYAVTQAFGALLYEKPLNYQLVIATATVAGFLLTMPLRYLYRRLWGRSPLAIVSGVLISCYVAALALRGAINYAYKVFVEADWEFKTLFEIFGGALSSTYLLLCWSGLYFGIKYWESLQQQREAALRAEALAREAQFKMLRYQLNPHFLFNTLNAISTLILDNQNRTANRAVTRLAEFLRYTLDQDPMKTVTLRQELQALDLYLSTERLRFGERMRLQYDISEPAYDALLPSLLLQPLIENAMKYAVAPREEGGSVRIAADVQGDSLRIVVSDDGPGISLAAASPEGRGVGLRNTRERLAVLYGDRHHFSVVNTNAGLRIEIVMPFEKAASLPEPGRKGSTSAAA